MNFYRVGRSVGLTGGTEFFLNQSIYSHKAVLFGNTVGGNVKITFHDSLTNTPTGITLTIPTSGSTTPFIIPSVVRSITPATTQNIILLS